jgi:hypothetical protein
MPLELVRLHPFVRPTAEQLPDGVVAGIDARSLVDPPLDVEIGSVAGAVQRIRTQPNTAASAAPFAA